MLYFLPAKNQQVLVSDADLFKSSVQIFIYWIKLLRKLEFLFSFFQPSDVHLSQTLIPVSNVLYRTFALIVLWKVFITK